MSCSKLQNYRKLKKLPRPPSSKRAAWKSFFIATSSSFTSTLRHYSLNKIPKSIHSSTKRLFLALRYYSAHLCNSASLRRYFSCRPWRPYHASRYNCNRRSHRPLMARTPTASPASPIYVDQLFVSRDREPQIMNEVSEERADQTDASSSTGGGGDGNARGEYHENWREYVSSMPRIPGVDEQAEEFISKFHEQLRIQREHSIIRFQEMLARGT